MDQFGVLVESIGFKSQYKSTPLADLKGKTNINNGFPPNLDFNTKPPSNSGDGSGLGGVFGSNNDLKTQNYNGFDDVFGGSNLYDLDSVFKGSYNSGPKSGLVDNSDDIFGVFSGPKSPGSMNYDNVFGKIPPPPKRNDLNDDLLGGFSNMGSKPSNVTNNNSVHMSKNVSGFDDLIPGFGGGSDSKNRANSERSNSWHSSDQYGKSNEVLLEDPFNIFESSPQRNSTSTLIPDPLKQGASKISVQSSFDELEDFATGRMSDAKQKSDTHVTEGVEMKNIAKQESVHREQKKIGKMGVEGESQASENVDVLESFISMGTSSRYVPSPSSVPEDSVYDTLFQKSKVAPNQRPGIQISSPTRKVSPVVNGDDDFSFLSGVEVAPSSEVFQEVEGESEERRRARLNHHKNTQDRMIKALNEKNQRDRQVQLEQEERNRLAATLDDDIKRWASGKEGNLRALLSSLQYVLWPECGWRPVSLTDMITSMSVKKVYQKATLCVHPDKVQQKGANIQQKYIAEKVFDVLKVAYNKFSSQEL